MKYLIINTFLLLSLNVFAGTRYDQLIRHIPKDAVKIIDRDISCRHWQGEMPSDAESLDESAQLGPED